MSVLLPNYCPRCERPLGLYMTDGSYEMRHRGRTVRVYAPARMEITCEDCRHMSVVALDKEYTATLV